MQAICAERRDLSKCSEQEGELLDTLHFTLQAAADLTKRLVASKGVSEQVHTSISESNQQKKQIVGRKLVSPVAWNSLALVCN